MANTPGEAVGGTPVSQTSTPPPVSTPTGPSLTSPVNNTGAVPSNSSFRYGSDVGVSSIAGIQELERSSGIVLPDISDFRNGAKGYHGTMNAVDFGGSVEAMRQVSAYLLQFYPYFLELIHTDAAMPNGGAYVKNGVIVPQSYYDGPDIDTGVPIIQEHVNHIHVAMTMSALQAASSGAQPSTSTPVTTVRAGLNQPTGAGPAQNSNLNDVLTSGTTQNQGCFKKASAAAVFFLFGAVTSLYEWIGILHHVTSS